MRRGILVLALAALLSSKPALTQTENAGSAAVRKVAVRIAPAYPELARKMHIHGAVRIECIVRANGTVRSTRILGGNPVLVDAAQDAMSKWMFEPAQGETTEVVQLSFEGQ